MTDLVHRQVAVIATPFGTPAALAAKAATATIPIVFGVAEDPVRLGLVASLARPGGNATGINNFSQEVAAKRLRLLHDLVPKAVRLPCLSTRPTLPPPRPIAGSAASSPHHRAANPDLNANTIGDFDTAFADFRARAPMPSSSPAMRSSPAAACSLPRLTARDKIPASLFEPRLRRGGRADELRSQPYGRFHQVGVYTGRILKGEKPADLPVQQSTKFEFSINLKTAKALGLDVPPALLAVADEVIE